MIIKKKKSYLGIPFPRSTNFVFENEAPYIITLVAEAQGAYSVIISSQSTRACVPYNQHNALAAPTIKEIVIGLYSL